MLEILQNHFLPCVGVTDAGFEQKQFVLGNSLQTFILHMTGNEVIECKNIPSMSNMMEPNGAPGVLKKLMKRVEFEPYFLGFEERFVRERGLILSLLEKVYPTSQRVNIAPAPTEIEPEFSEEEQQNLSMLYELKPDFSEEKVKHVFVTLAKNFEDSMNKLLSMEADDPMFDSLKKAPLP